MAKENPDAPQYYQSLIRIGLVGSAICAPIVLLVAGMSSPGLWIPAAVMAAVVAVVRSRLDGARQDEAKQRSGRARIEGAHGSVSQGEHVGSGRHLTPLEEDEAVRQLCPLRPENNGANRVPWGARALGVGGPVRR